MKTAVNRKLRIRRVLMGLSQESLGRRVGVTDVFISYVETGARRPNAKMKRKIAKVLDVSVEDLFLGA